jgi:hypothetical protein
MTDRALEILWEWHCRQPVEADEREDIRAVLRYAHDAEAVKRHAGECETADKIAETIRVLEGILMADD